MEPATLPTDGAATPRRLRLSPQTALRVAAAAIAALLLLVVFCAYRQPGLLIDFANLRLC